MVLRENSSKSLTDFERREQLIICHHLPEDTQLKHLYPKHAAFCLLVFVKLLKKLLLLRKAMVDDESLSLKRERSQQSQQLNRNVKHFHLTNGERTLL